MWTLAAGWLFAAGAMGQDVSVQAFINESTIGTEDILSYTLQIENASRNEIVRPEPPATEGLVLLRTTPNSAISSVIANGQLRQSVSYEWLYRPSREGEARILAAAVTVDGETYRTEPITVNVVPQSQRPSTSSRRRTVDPLGAFARPTPGAQEDAQTITERDLFIRAVPSARSAYRNEQVNIEYQLYFREGMQLRQSRLADSWDAEGFWREELDVERRPIPQTVVENGLRYNTIVLKRVAVFPTRAGELEIDPLKIEAEAFIPTRSSNPFDQFFSYRPQYEPVEVASPAIKIDVLPLPDDAPEAFNGAVGSFHIEASVDRTAIEVGEPVEVEVRITGTGNIATLEPPPFSPPGVFEQYDPQISTAINRNGRRVTGTKTLTYVLIPRSNGTFQLPQLEMAYFNTDRNRYETLRPEPTAVRVTGTASAPVSALTSAMGLPVDDIAGIQSESRRWIRARRNALHRSALVYLALLLPLAVVGAATVMARRAQRMAGDIGFARNRRAHPLAKKHLHGAMELLSRFDSRGFYSEVERAIRSFIGNRLNIAETGLTYQQLDTHLERHGAPAALRQQVVGLLQECDEVRFAPIPPDQAAMNTACDRASELIVQLDHALGR